MQLLKLLALFLVSTQCLCNSHLPNHRHISIVGNSEILVHPDAATMYLSVSYDHEQSLQAKEEVDKRVNNFLNGLSDFGIDERNISASQLTVTPRYSYAPNEDEVIVGHTAKRKLKVSLDDLTKMNALMDFALAVKINELNKIELTTTNKDELNSQAIRLAVKDASSRAQALADALGVKLGDVYSINTTSNTRNYRFGSNDDKEIIEVAGINSVYKKGKGAHNIGKYLQENIVVSGRVNVVFDLDVQ